MKVKSLVDCSNIYQSAATTPPNCTKENSNHLARKTQGLIGVKLKLSSSNVHGKIPIREKNLRITLNLAKVLGVDTFIICGDFMLGLIMLMI